MTLSPVAMPNRKSLTADNVRFATRSATFCALIIGALAVCGASFARPPAATPNPLAPVTAVDYGQPDQ